MDTLHYLNLRASGLSHDEATKKTTGEAPKVVEPVTEPKKPTIAERKAELTKEIVALCGEVPKGNASVEKFEETVTQLRLATDGL